MYIDQKMVPHHHPLHSLLFLRGSSRSLVLSCLLLAVVVVEPHLAYGSSSGGGGGGDGGAAHEKGARAGFLTSYAPPPKVGICEAMVTSRGYKCQEFKVKTEDGYILSLQRIPEGRSGTNNNNNAESNNKKTPVLLQHGLYVDGMTWVMNSPQESLGFILADRGYDVWISNFRGTRYCRAHETLDSNYASFWNWTWDELSAYDLPANLDFVYRQTGKQKIHYVGHSMGTLTAFAAFSEGRLVDKLRSATMLSPVAYLSHMTTALGSLMAKAFLGETASILGMAEFNPKGEPVKNLIKFLCVNPAVDCYDLMSAFTGMNCCLNHTTIDVLVKNEPQPTSTKNLVHLAQSARDGVLTKYNYVDEKANVKKYGKAKPPEYDLSKIPTKFPLFIGYGGRDSLADTEDVKLLLDKLKSHDKDKLTIHFIKNYAHVDYILAINAKDVLYNDIVAFFKRH